MDTQIEIGSGFTLILSDTLIDRARVQGVTMIAFPTPGISWYPRTHSWRAYVYIDGRQKHLGYFKDKDTAIRAREAATWLQTRISS